MVSFKAAPVSSGGYGGAGGAAGNLAAAGAAGVLSSGGAGTAGFGSGGDGSPVLDALPSDGQAPGGGGGGAASDGPAITGGKGGGGRMSITRVTTQEFFRTLILHVPGKLAPQELSPMVSVTPGDLPDGQTEYPVPSRVAGVNAQFRGTYSVVAAANHFDSPAANRMLTVAVTQYEYAGGPSYTTRVSWQFSPVADSISNGLVVLGNLTLPIRDVAEDNTACYYTVSVLDTNQADISLDLMFLDSSGQTVIIKEPAAGYQVYYLDAPTPQQAVGRVMGSSAGRAAAVSVIRNCDAVSGGPLSLRPGDNFMFAWSDAGFPELSLQYIPAWQLERVY